MKKVISFVSVCLVFLFLLSSCSIPRKRPESGIYWCEELKILINFSELGGEKGTLAGKLYHDDGSYSNLHCFFDYGSGVGFSSEDEETSYLIGEFVYEDSVFMVRRYTDDRLFNFFPITEEVFDIDDYAEEIEEFSTWRLNVGPIKDAEDAAAKADAIFKEKYDESSLERQRPYIVLYDEEADAWLIHGKWPEEGVDGGSAYMIVRGSDGKVIAVWHDL